MLARQARRSFSLHQTTSRRPIGLSSRYPALQRSVVTQQTRLWRRRGSESSHGLPHGRSLATAVDDFKFGNSPYNQLGDHGLPPFQNPSRVYNVRTFDPSSPLVIPEPTAPVPAPARINSFGIPGDLEDMLPVFDACIQVGKLQRASLVLKRMNIYGMVSPEERIILHNRYLRASLDQMRTSPDRKQAEQLHKWYELQIRNQEIPQTAETIACMLKASLLSERGSRLQRLVNRYMGMAPGEAGLRVLGMDDILSDQDLAVITEICPTYNYTPESEDFDAISLASEEQQAGQLESEVSQTTVYPEVTVTPQRGEGLNTLKRALGLMMELQDVDISKLSPEEQIEFQTRLESDAIDSAIAKWREANKNLQKMGVNTALSANAEDGSLSQHLPSWLSGMEARLKVELEKIEESENRDKKTREDLERCVYGPFLRQANPTRLAAVTILTVLNVGALIGADRGVVVSRLVHDIARVAQEDIRTQMRDELKKKQRQRRKVQFMGDAAKARANHDGPIIADADQPELSATPQEAEGLGADDKSWSLAIKGQVGSILLKSLIETAKVKVIKEHPVTKQLISQYQPAFSHLMQPRKGKKIGVLILNAELVERMKREPVGDFIAKHLPMVAQPQPWKAMHEGGFLASKSTLVRTKPGDVEQKLYAKAAIQRGDMDQVLKALDVLGKTAWRINNDVLKVMLDAWNSGEELANMPALHPDLELPTEPDASDDPMLRRDWARAVKVVENERSGLHSQRCYMNLQLEIARAFRNQTVYFPHNVDYRGRAYPIPTYLNHMGADHTRAILKFAKGKELGASGLRWLKIHLSNLYGFDKASFDDREAFATENADNIIESATNPLKGSRWWLKAEDPWQCLAACFELKAALELPDPTKFVSQLPVHQDGTCNGLQHYAALGGDTWGAKQVNLEPGAKPADVYSAVADLVKDLIAKDVKADNPLAKVIDGKITRKVVKQTVMTNVYGVTFSGAKKQVLKQLDAIYPDLHKEGFPPMLCATYIAKHIFTALGTMFRGAHDIQYWLGEAGGRICKSLTPTQIQQIASEYEEEQAASSGTKSRRKFKIATDELSQQFRSTLVWTTPLRMPVAQPYRKSTNREIHTCLQSITYPVSDQTDPVNRKKQLQGFPPNFIHSLDASHMLLSALQCDELGLNFAAVHDSFWTHAADVDTMNTVLRDAFIRIHEEDVVGRLLAEFEARYKGSLRLVNIDPDSPMGQKIKEFRAKSKLDAKEELLLEYKRTQLRLSGNPWDLEAAEKIITPASVYEEMSAAEVQEAELEEDAEHVALGVIPEGEAKLDGTTLAKETKHQVEQEMEEPEDVDDLATQASQQFVDSLLENTNTSHFEKNVIEPKETKKSTRGKNPLAIWLPLSFPPIPQKGDFNVSRLRDSKYFFS